MEVSGQLHATVALSPGRKAPEPIGYEGSWAQNQYERNGEQKDLLPLPGI
jgi:hypothetical protein